MGFIVDYLVQNWPFLLAAALIGIPIGLMI
jgi:hypothetical protein